MRRAVYIWMTFFLTMLMNSTVLAIDEPEFEVVAELNGVEFRRYQSYVVAETVIAGEQDRNEAAYVGFRRLFDYIGGENKAATKISMTAPVQQRLASTKISMTAPVRQVASAGGWTVAFVLPAQFNAANAPQPTNPDIAIRSIPGELVAALRYSGRWNDKNVDTHKTELLSQLAGAGVSTQQDVVIAFYNGPFTLPFMRRNEVLVVVDQLP